jgi:branched-subunit amino acid aminotransferase/4-amino-4-deoxychorismate lyase
VKSGRARVTFFDESPTRVWHYEGVRKTSLLIVTGDSRAVSENYRLDLSPHLINSTSPLAGVKSCNYLEHLMAYSEAKGRGLDEAIRSNERGEAASACMANVFWQKGERLFTPSLKTGCLAGTMREFVLENIECEEVETGIDALRDADAVFLTSAGLGIVRVAEFDGRELRGKDHPILQVASHLKSS